MVFVSKRDGDEDVWMLRAGQATPITAQGVIDANPAWSPDGSRVAFTSGPVEDLDLYTMAADGSDRRLVWAGDTLQSSVDWSPDGESLVVDAYAADGTLQVFTIPVSGDGDAVQLTHGKPNGKPTWLPDGSGLLFLSLRDGDQQEIYSMAIDGSDPMNLTHHPARDVLAEMAPDGRQIAYASDRSGDREIWVMNANGSDPVRLTRSPGDDSNPTWSSDGRHLLFTSDRQPKGIWAMHPDGSQQEPVMPGGWTPDCP